MFDSGQETPVVQSGSNLESVQSAAGAAVKPMSPLEAGRADPNAPMSLSSVNDLKEKAPEVYKATLMSIGMLMVRQMQAHQRRLKRLIRGED